MNRPDLDAIVSSLREVADDIREHVGWVTLARRGLEAAEYARELEAGIAAVTAQRDDYVARTTSAVSHIAELEAALEPFADADPYVGNSIADYNSAARVLRKAEG